MIKIMFFDGFVCELEDGVLLLDLVLGIFKFLVKVVLFVKVNGQDWDLKCFFEGDVDVVLIIKKDEDEVFELVCYDMVYILVQVV